MKKVILITALIISQVVLASKARVSALQGADHLVDTQSVFNNPADINKLSPYITFEMGAAGAGAEGGFSRKLMNGNTLGVYLGHDNTNDLRDGATLLKQRNPVEVIYGINNMGFSGSLSTTDDKKNGKKETTLVGKFGLTEKDFSFWTNIALMSQSEDKTTNTKMNTAPQITAGGNLNVDTVRYFGQLNIGNYKKDVGATTTVGTTYKDMGLKVGFLNQDLATKETDIYYGAELNYVQRDIEGKKITTTNLPVFLGVEHNLTTWTVFRGSVKQNIIIGDTKDETATNTDAQSVGSNTTFSGGLGLKYNKLTLDGSLASSTNGQINGNAFLTQASVTYNY